MKNNKKLIALVAVVLVAVLMVFAYSQFAAKPSEGSKSVTLEVINSASESVVYELKTDAEFLRGVMDEAKAQGFEYEGEEGPYGLNILSVNGEQAIYDTDKAYWSIMVNGEYGMYGADQQPVADGDAYQLVYTKA